MYLSLLCRVHGDCSHYPIAVVCILLNSHKGVAFSVTRAPNSRRGLALRALPHADLT